MAFKVYVRRRSVPYTSFYFNRCFIAASLSFLSEYYYLPQLGCIDDDYVILFC
jgi:hypothetical protein